MNKTHQGILFAFILTSLPLARALSNDAGQVPPANGGQSGTLASQKQANSQSPILQDLFKSQFGQDQLAIPQGSFSGSCGSCSKESCGLESYGSKT